MKRIIERLWLEPAYFIGAVCTLGQVFLQIVDWPNEVEIPLVVLLGGSAAHAVRSSVTPTRR